MLSIYVDMNVALRAVVDDLERDPLALHAADEDMATSVVPEGTILVVQHSRSSGLSLLAIMLDLEEGEWNISGGRNVDLAREFGNISVRVGVLISERDLGARVFAACIIHVW